jgi:hypothetical protein
MGKQGSVIQERAAKTSGVTDDASDFCCNILHDELTQGLTHWLHPSVRDSAKHNDARRQALLEPYRATRCGDPREPGGQGHADQAR